MALLLRRSVKYWSICWAITASSGHITITVVWPQTKPSEDIGLAITMWPELVDHYTEDFSDLVTAIKTDTFNDDLHLTNTQVQRLTESNLKSDIRFILEKLVNGDKAIGGHQYYEIKPSDRRKIKEKLKKVYITHLRRTSLTTAEQTILSASI